MLRPKDSKSKLIRLRAKKSLGQHFLRNRRAIGQIVDALEIRNHDTIIEIGPGNGELTYPLIEQCRNSTDIRIIAIEKDEALAERLRIKNQELGIKNIEVIAGDALEILPSLIRNSTYKIVGNIPYYITGRLLRIISELENKPAITILTIQKEVAERICAKPPKMNLLATHTQLWATPSIITNLPKSDFAPQPKVTSSIVKLTTHARYHSLTKEENDIIRHIFLHPRKTIINNLATLGAQKYDILSLLRRINVRDTDRPGELSLEQICEIVSLLRREPQ